MTQDNSKNDGDVLRKLPILLTTEQTSRQQQITGEVYHADCLFTRIARKKEKEKERKKT